MANKQEALFEEDFIRRDLGPVVSQPDVALAELVANAWDAGATAVRITIPEAAGGDLIVADDGTGMTKDEFEHRWRTLRYNRKLHQGAAVQFPPGVHRHPRTAYGQNGVGRHAMLCFADTYQVTTTKGGERCTYEVKETSGEAPFSIELVEAGNRGGHGTELRCVLSRRVPFADDMRQILSARFLHDPEFMVYVNGENVPLEDHEGLLLVEEYEFAAGMVAKLFVVDSGETARTKFQHGVAFWVARRLVGKPGWTLDGRSILDGRTKEAKRLTFIVVADGLQEHVSEDWTGFRTTPEVKALESATAEIVEARLREMLSQRVEEKVNAVIRVRREHVRDLDPLAQLEVTEFARDVAVNQPLVPNEVLASAVDALIRLDNTRSGQALIQKLATMGADDVEGLNRLLDEWSVRDALSVLDEVGKRIRVAEAIQKLSNDPSVDELKTLHPLVTQARWLFGTEFDSPHFISNVTLRRAVERIVGPPVDGARFANPKKRPDLLFLDRSTVSATGIDGWEDGLSTIERILLIELKRGGSTIGRKEMSQAQEYVEELIGSAEIPGQPRIVAYVVGHRVDNARALSRNIEDRSGTIRGTVIASSFDRLVDSANKRLFHLREVVEPVFPEGADSLLMRETLAQQSIL